jgi:ABC-type nickel/cobalt efflux system permease component RcnA
MSLKRTFCALAALALVLLFVPCNDISANPFLSSDNNKPAYAPPPVYGGRIDYFVTMQFEYREKVAHYLRGIKDSGTAGFLLMFIAVSFLYGLFHAAGPGHRKTVVFSLFFSRRARWFEPACAGFLSSLVHAGTSIAIISLLYIIQARVISLAESENIYALMEGVTFIILAVMSILLIANALFRLVKRGGDSSAVKTHSLYVMVVVSSLVPCPGAAMLMLLSLYAGMLWAGIVGVLAMSVGMGVVISLSGYLAYTGRSGLFFRLKKREHALIKVSALLEILSYGIILLFSLFMAWPFIRSVI